ncbi:MULTISPECIES: hypothetical protein [unclassified Helicobacter]|uniref:hypothetical protein n=1 Tax=unclassified Helicobacter TaxID=2593540 RepID=UPI00115FFB86|nr:MULTISPECIES: hypothetical protein [unclassified Helicobacter]
MALAFCGVAFCARARARRQKGGRGCVDIDSSFWRISCALCLSLALLANLESKRQNPKSRI